jgi:uncharacterized protein YcbK (DUF882 family)
MLNFLINLFKNLFSKSEVIKEKPKEIKEIITLDQYFMGRREKYSNEFAQYISDNAIELLKVVNPLLMELGISNVEVSSGWRPNSLNSGISNAAQHSNHVIGKAVDIKDPDNKLDNLLRSHPELLRKYGLFLESPESTPGWAHLDNAIRTDRPTRIFIP